MQLEMEICREHELHRKLEEDRVIHVQKQREARATALHQAQQQAQQAEAQQLQQETAAMEAEAERVATEAAQIAANRNAYLLKQTEAVSKEAARAQQGQQQESLLQQAKDHIAAYPLPVGWQWNWCTDRYAVWYHHVATWGPYLGASDNQRAHGGRARSSRRKFGREAEATKSGG